MQHDNSWHYAEQFIGMLTVDLHPGILAEQILTLAVAKLVAELEEGGIAYGRVIRLSRSELCQAMGKVTPFHERQIRSTMNRMAAAVLHTRRLNGILYTSLLERYECVRNGDDLALVIVLSPHVIAMLKQDWRARLN